MKWTLRVQQHGERARDDERRSEVADDNGCADDVKQKSGDFRGGSGIDRALAGVYEVRADNHCCKRQQSSAHYPATEDCCDLGAHSSKKRNNRKGANTGDRSASTIALEPKQ